MNPTTTVKAPVASLLWPTVWLFVLLVAVKASYVKLATYWYGTTLVDYLSWLFVQWLAAMTQTDAIFALGAGLAFAALARLNPRQAGWRQAVVGMFVVFAVLCVIYAVVSRQVYAYYSAPLTYQLLTLGGEPAKLWSSLEVYLTAPALIAVVGLPVLFVLLVQGSRRREASWSAQAKKRARLVLLAVAAAWLALGTQLAGSVWFVAQDRHLVDSPHTVFLESLVLAVAGSGAGLSDVEVDPQDLLDFKSATPAQPGAPGTRAATGLPAERPRNVIVIVLESVGSRYLGIYGSQRDTTPRLLAEQSSALVFDSYYAPVAWTAYSLIALVKSQRPPMERYNELEFSARSGGGDSLAQTLRKQGLRTAFMSAGTPDWASHGFLERNGFDEVVRGNELPGALAVSSWGTTDRTLFDTMLQWIDRRRDKPFFLMAWTDQTHHPYPIAPDQRLVDVLPPGKDGGASDLARYLSLVRESDTQIGRLLDHLRRSGLAEDTLVVVTGDHGEAFADPHSGNGHGFTVYDEEVRVPLMLWNPRLFKDGRRSDVVGSHLDLAPTLLDLMGIPQPAHWHGRSLFDPDRPPRTYLFAAAWGQYLLGVRERHMKYIYDARKGQGELYDLAVDPDEQKNIAAAEPALALRLRQRLAAWMQVERQDATARR